MPSFLPLSFLLYAVMAVFTAPSLAQEECSPQDRLCILQAMQDQAALIDTASWRDQTYREIAKTWAFEGQTDRAIALIDRIETPDTKAMTIRGIGMAAADKNYSSEEYDRLFTKLKAEADKITHPPSFAIALTYIAMGQAFAGENEGAWATAASMDNEALRHKAYAETSEIQAERGDFAAAMKSIGFIESPAFQNKAYETISKILADSGKLTESYQAAGHIANPYKKIQALQYILDKQKPRDVSNQ